MEEKRTGTFDGERELKHLTLEYTDGEVVDLNAESIRAGLYCFYGEDGLLLDGRIDVDRFAALMILGRVLSMVDAEELVFKSGLFLMSEGGYKLVNDDEEQEESDEEEPKEVSEEEFREKMEDE